MPPQQSKSAPDFIPYTPTSAPDFIPAESATAPVPAQTEQPSMRQNFQTAFDELATPPKFDPHHPISSGAQDFGAGVIGLMSPIFHPEQTAKGFAELSNPVTAPMATAPIARGLVSAFRRNPVGEGIAAVPGVVSAFVAPEAEGAARDIGSATERGGLNLGNAALGARGPKLFKWGANPARGAFEEGVLPAMSKHSASMKLEQALPQAGERVSNAVTAGGSVPLTDIARSVDQPVNDLLSTIRGPGGGNRPVEPIHALRESMGTRAPGASAPIYGPGAGTRFTAPDVWRTIQNIDRNTRFNPDPEVEGVNELRRGIRGGLRGNLEEAVPGLRPLSQRYGDLKAAEEALDRTMHSGSGLSKMAKVPMFPIESGVGKAMFRAGRGIRAASPFARVASQSAPVTALMNDLRRHKEQ